MAEPEFRRMSVEEFLDWHERQEERYEPVNGFPIQIFPPKGMTGGGAFTTASRTTSRPLCRRPVGGTDARSRATTPRSSRPGPGRASPT